MCGVKIMLCRICVKANVKDQACEALGTPGNKNKYTSVMSRGWMSAHTAVDPSAVVTTILIVVCPTCLTGNVNDLTNEDLPRIAKSANDATRDVLGKFIMLIKDVEIFRWTRRTFASPTSDTEYETETDDGSALLGQGADHHD